ncbi:MAG: EF-P beta-lysylation protein EpmB [Gammaproteobacteria bacterium]|nr:MAG: EF-P beta-lysylation protein EpmB [Gammaproteobacteria bacterium]
MIPFSSSTTNRKGWQQQLVEGLRSAVELLDYLGLTTFLDSHMEEAAARFPLRVTRYYANLMERGDFDDPLLRQVLPSPRELETADGFTRDPTGDLTARAGPGMLRKYRGRALVIASGGCAINCRYCFRRHYPYQENRASPGAWEPLLSGLAGDDTVSEIILSGGDPLMLSNSRLETLVGELGRIGHLKRLRIHSRLPVVLPDRVDHGLVEILDETRLKCTLVLHVNHPRELTPELGRALEPLAAAGIILLNQSVLLRKVNDAPGIQVDLCEKLFDYNILPYYLHQLDKVEGAAHFLVADARAREIHGIMRQRLPGYLLPRLVREEPGADSKQPL